jgi:hypothetical protein
MRWHGSRRRRKGCIRKVKRCEKSSAAQLWLAADALRAGNVPPALASPRR